MRQQPELEIGELLKKKALKLGIVESATGGLISHRITDVAGSSAYYQGSITAYSNEIKLKLVGVKVETLMQHGAVSAQVAEQLAMGGLKVLNADICIADTGIAGPGGGTTDKPAGLVYMALADKNGASSRRYCFTGSRKDNKESFAGAALSWLAEYLAGREGDGG